MKSIGIIFAGILLTFIFYAFFMIGDNTDGIIARSIPVYPNSSNIEASSNVGFPDGQPSGHVYFYTNDIQESVFKFYDIEFKKRGWIQNSNTYSKQILNHKFTATIISRPKESKDNWWIAIDHDR